MPMTTPTIDELLRERAIHHAAAPFLRFPGVELTYGAFDERVTAVARGLAGLGVGPGDHVVVMMANCVEFAVAWFAVARLGAVEIPVNTDFRGPALAHVLALAAAPVVICDAALADRLADVVVGGVAGPSGIETLVVRGDPTAARAGFPGRVLAFDDLATAGDPLPVVARGEADPALVLFTSGTTGRSKGCVLSNRYVVRHAELIIEHLGLRGDDVLYCPFPLFHLDATVLTVVPALVLGATAAIGERFSASGFWDELRAFGATVFDFMGATLAILYKAPAGPGDDRHPARLGWGVPLPEFTPDFERRFGVRLVELYGSTDVGLPIYTPLDEPRRLGSCGRPIANFDVRLFGDDGREVTTGSVGEIVVRPNEPSLINDGYLGMPAESLAARRDLWFHTGDLARADEDGFVYFVGRRKDAIRRRGENISAFEVEEVVGQHPDVLEVAAFGVPSDLTEEEVMIAVVARPDRHLDPVALVAFCETNMARYMVPRYIDVVDQLPKTPTEKIEKYRLIERGVTPTTWDRRTG